MNVTKKEFKNRHIYILFIINKICNIGAINIVMQIRQMPGDKSER